MILSRQSIVIDRDPDTVWTVLNDPNRAPLWNPKIQRIEAATWGERAVGYRYRIQYELNRKKLDFDAEIEEFFPPKRLVVRMRGGGIKPPGYVHEIYELEPYEGPDRTRLTQIMDVHDDRMKWYWSLLIRLVLRFGKPIGKAYLVRLKELVEAE